MTHKLKLKPVASLRTICGIPVDQELRFNQIIVTGPPGSGKSTFIGSLGGWPEEGYIDLSLKGWWRARALSLRPREVHLGLPFVGRVQALALFHEDWLAHWRELELDESRILVPPTARHLLSVDWRSRYVFEFLIPTAGTLVRRCRARAQLGTHPIDRSVNPEVVRRQLDIYARVALHLHRRGMTVYVRTAPASPPARIVDTPSERIHG
jgi:hypothetical protein